MSWFHTAGTASLAGETILRTEILPQRRTRDFCGRRSSPTGFTLLELIFVAAILLAVVGLTVPRFRGMFDFLQLKNLTSDVVSFARYAQAKAVMSGRTYRLAFELEKRAIAMETLRSVESGAGELKEKWVTEKFRAIPPSVSVEFQGDRRSINFYPDATADGATVTVRVRSGKVFVVSVEPSTGYIDVTETPQE